MELKIVTNKNIDISKINDAMELDSSQSIAEGTFTNGERKIEMRLLVVGDVDVEYRGQTYKHASRMPDELLKIFHDGRAGETGSGITVNNNNWFELVVDDDGRRVIEDVVDGLGDGFPDIVSLMLDTYVEYVNDNPS